MNVQARAIAHLIRHGVIDIMTIQRMGTTDARKMFSRLRRMGYLRPLDNPRGFQLLPNREPKRGE